MIGSNAEYAESLKLSIIDNNSAVPPQIDTSIYDEALKYVSDSSFEEDKWLVKVPEYHIKKEISFASMSVKNNFNISLLKCWTVHMLSLSYSLATIKNKLNKVESFIAFLEKNKINFLSIRNSFIESYLNKYSESETIYNSMSCAIFDFASFVKQNGYELAEEIVCPTLNVCRENKVRRAPDKCVIERLDEIFFSGKGIPSDMRCIYLLLRLILNRISEVLNMQIDCISYYEEKIYTLSIPTQKETPMRRMLYSKYNRSLTNAYTATLYEAVQQQIEYARSCQDKLTGELKGYLFVSTAHPDRLVTREDFNELLAKVCKENKVLDACGHIAKISSHHLRHTGIVERLHSKEISPEQTMKEANHSNMATTLSYGYESMHDESVRTSQILRQVFPDDYKSKTVSTPVKLNERKYQALLENPFVRLLPGLGLCANISCNPAYESCIECEHFEPNKYYYDYFVECKCIVNERLVKLEKNPKTNKEAISFNKNQVKIYEKFIERIEQKYEIA